MTDTPNASGEPDELYLDAAATEPVTRNVIEAMMPFMTDAYANPASVHQPGKTAARALDAARASFAAGLGMVSVFCGVTNSPLTSLLLAYELFGGVGLELIALGCGVCYMLSGTHGLYSSQLFVTEKLLSEYTESWGKRLHR